MPIFQSYDSDHDSLSMNIMPLALVEVNFSTLVFYSEAPQSPRQTQQLLVHGKLFLQYYFNI